MSEGFLFDGPADAGFTLLLAHGAGAPMDSGWMNASAKAFAEAGLRVARFEFAYMAARRTSSVKRPPPRAETVKAEYLAAIAALGAKGRLVVGGKSFGGRVASLIADEAKDAGEIAGLLCLGYPFHPLGKPDQLRTAHLAALRTPTLIAQGTRDPFGTREEVATYKLARSVELLWLKDGDHDFKPRKAISGLTMDQSLDTMAKHAAAWIRRVVEQRG